MQNLEKRITEELQDEITSNIEKIQLTLSNNDGRFQELAETDRNMDKGLQK